MSANPTTGDSFKAMAKCETTTKMQQRRFNIAPMMKRVD